MCSKAQRVHSLRNSGEGRILSKNTATVQVHIKVFIICSARRPRYGISITIANNFLSIYKTTLSGSTSKQKEVLKEFK